MVHRDIKPSNILIDGEGRVKLADFGIAQRLSSESATHPRITAAGFVVGTPSYMSPEQARQSLVGPPSDIFSLGCLAFELVIGAPPFELASTVGTMHAVLNAPVPSLQGFGLPAAYIALLERALDKDPEGRPTAREFAEALVPLADAKIATRRSPARWSKTRRWRWARPAAVGLAFLAVAGAAIWQWPASTSPPALSFEAHGTVLMGPPANRSDDPSLGGVLRTALQIGLEQSPYVNVLSPQRIQLALARMRHAPDEALTEATALEICQREGVKALIASGIEQVGGQFVLTARIVDPATGGSVRTLVERANTQSEIPRRHRQAGRGAATHTRGIVAFDPATRASSWRRPPRRRSTR